MINFPLIVKLKAVCSAEQECLVWNWLICVGLDSSTGRLAYFHGDFLLEFQILDNSYNYED